MIYPKESYDIIGAAMKVHSIMGPGFTEKVYQEALALEFKECDIPFQREVAIHASYKGVELEGTFVPDFICYNKIIVELKAVRELDDAMGDTEVQIDVKIRQDAREDLQQDIADLFDGYEIAMELDKLDIPADLAQQIFGLQATSLPQIQAIIEQWHEANLFIGEDGEKVYKDTMERIADMEDRENRERLKKYLALLNDATDARITIKQKELRELREIDKLENVPEPERNLMREKVRENAEKELLQQQWKEFKDSDLYVQMFENLDKASMKSLGVMRSQLEEMRASLSNLDPANAKEVARAIERIDEATHNRHPLRYLNEDLKKAQEYISNRQTWEKALTDAMTRAAELTQSRNDAADIAAGWWDQYQKYSDQGLTNEASYSYIMWQKAHDVTERYAKQLEETKTQVRSYAKLLGVRYAVIASKEKVWVMSAKDDYSDAVFEATWDELANTDIFYSLNRLIGGNKR